MRIGIFTDTYYPQISGVATVSSLLKKRLTDMGHEVYIITVYDPAEEEEENVLRVLSLPFLSQKRAPLAFLPGYEQKIIDLDLDIIHSQTEFGLGSLAARIARRQNIPLIHTYHTLYDYWIVGQFGEGISSKIARNFTKRRSVRQCNIARRVIVPTGKTLDFLNECEIKTPITVLPSGIDLEPFRRARENTKDISCYRRRLGIPEDAFVLLYVGRISEEKKIDEILFRMPELMRDREDLYFLLVGNGHKFHEYQAWAKDRKLDGRILFTGQVAAEEVAKYYALADVFASASRSETQGLTYIEALASGLPILVYPDSCLNGVLEVGGNGLAFSSPNEFKESLIALYEDKEMRARLSRGALEKAQEFCEEYFIEEICRIYSEIS